MGYPAAHVQAITVICDFDPLVRKLEQLLALGVERKTSFIGIENARRLVQ